MNLIKIKRQKETENFYSKDTYNIVLEQFFEKFQNNCNELEVLI